MPPLEPTDATAPVPGDPAKPFSTVVVIAAVVLTLAVVVGLMFLIGAPSAGAAGGCGGG